MHAIEALLCRWIDAVAPEPASAWLATERAALREAFDRARLVRALGLAPRRLGKADLILSQADLEEAEAVAEGFDPRGLSVDQAARMALLLASHREGASFSETLSGLVRTADLQELVAYLRGLAVFPAPEQLVWLADEGVRSAMRPVFEAIAHRNPFPRRHFDERAWNQMVLKALFIETSLAPIQGLDERANSDLAVMLVDYARERRAAGRSVSPELWRCVGRHAAQDALEDLARALASSDSRERRAAALALAASPLADAATVLADAQDAEAKAFVAGGGGWAELAGEVRS